LVCRRHTPDKKLTGLQSQPDQSKPPLEVDPLPLGEEPPVEGAVVDALGATGSDGALDTIPGELNIDVSVGDGIGRWIFTGGTPEPE